MTAQAHSRGWPTEWDGRRWIYSDTRKPDTGRRTCRRCGRKPTPEGYDACLGHIPGATSACCGHGVGPHVVNTELSGQQSRKETDRET